MPKFAANLSFLFTEQDFEDRFEAAAHTGFKAVECLFPYAIDAELYRQKLKDNGLKQALFNLRAGNWEAGERGIAALPGREADFLETAKEAFDYANAIDCPTLHVLSGLIPDEEKRDQALNLYCENILKIADEALLRNITLTIEPINPFDMPGYLVGDLKCGLDLIKRINHKAVRLQFDIYHRQRTSGQILDGLRESLGLIQHIQVASVPHRNEPSDCEINYPYIFQWLDEQGYDGYVGCEYQPKSESLQGLGWLSNYL